MHAGAVCVYHCDKLDLALLRIVDAGRVEPRRAVGVGCFDWDESTRTFRGAPREPRPELAHANTRVVCVGNPFDMDLECPDGETPRPMGFTPFWVSAGVLQGRLLTWKESAAKENLGRQRHSCWTYWGHSGAPLLRPVFHDDPDGDENSMQVEVVGIHNSWDDTNGQRHAVSLEDIQEFIQEFVDNDCLHNDCLDAEWQIGKYKGQIREDSESGSDEYDEYKDFGRSMSRSPPRDPIY